MNKFRFIFAFLVTCNVGVTLLAGQKALSPGLAVKQTTYYTTGPLTEKNAGKVLTLIEQLKKYVHGGFSPWNLMFGQKIRKQLSNDYHLNNVTTIEQLVKANGLILRTNDNALFLVKKEYQELLNDSLPDITFEENQVAILSDSCEEVKAFMEELESCYETERARDLVSQEVNTEQEKLDSLQKKYEIFEKIEKNLVIQIKELQAQISSK